MTAAAATALGCARDHPLVGRAREAPSSPYRLPSTVVPRRYEIRIEADLAQSRFTGEETIEVTVREPVDEIVLNAAQLQIQEASLRDERGRAFSGAVTLEETTQRARIRGAERFGAGVWQLRLLFTGVINDRLQGFYRSRARLPDGSETVLGVTQFQSADARRVFPCWDEPAFKAVFQLTLVVDERLTALSNASVESEQVARAAGQKIVRFAPTIPLSTYLVAFVVGDLESTKATMVDGVALRIWSVRGRTPLAGFAMEVGAFALRFYREYYGLPYPGGKLDLIAIPDFEAGAMENFGAVFFREVSLLVDVELASPREVRSVADVVAHEIAHMWFGDQVTMTWWNGLWLNEAFATFMQLLVVDALKPAWNRWVVFGNDRAEAFEIDALESTRPIEFDVRTPDEAEAMFDVLTYQKGAAILRMLEHYLGAAVFRAGIQKYLKRHRFANADAGDLWRSLSDASGRAVGEMMADWVLRPGYPLVNVRAEGGAKTLVFSQRRFTYRSDGPPSAVWKIPIAFRVRLPDAVKSMRVLLSSPEARVELPAPAEWVVVNENASGFYRTSYARELLARLAAELFENLSPLERFALVSDTWAAVLARVTPVSEYLDLTAKFGVESDRNVWSAIIDSVTYLGRVVLEQDRPALAALIRDRLGPAAARLGWSPAAGESEIQQELRADLLRALGTYGDDPAILASARQLHRRSGHEPSAVHPSLAAAVLAILAHGAMESDWVEFVERAENAKTPQEARRYIFALSHLREPMLIQRTLQMVIDGQVRSQDSPFLVRNLLMSVSARELTWRFVKENWNDLRRKLTQNSLALMCEGVAALVTPDLEADVRDFFSHRSSALGGKTLEQNLEKLRVGVALREREGAALSAYLSRFRSSR